jgi:hypothetical protein
LGGLGGEGEISGVGKRGRHGKLPAAESRNICWKEKEHLAGYEGGACGADFTSWRRMGIEALNGSRHKQKQTNSTPTS